MKHSKSRRILSALLAAVVVLAALPATALAVGDTAYVTISYEGSVLSKDGKDMYAVPVTLSPSDTVENAIATAVQSCGFTYEQTSGYGISSTKDFSTYQSLGQAYFGTYSGCDGMLMSAVFLNGNTTGGTLTNDLAGGDHIDIILYKYGNNAPGYLYFTTEGTYFGARTVHTSWTKNYSVYGKSYSTETWDYGTGSAVTDVDVTYYNRSDVGTYSMTYTPFETTGTVYAIATKTGYAPVASIITVSDSDANNAPALRSGVSATATTTTYTNKPWALNLSSVFEDIDGDPLTYKVKVDEAEAVTAAVDYSYTPTTTGDTSLIFTANDGFVDSVNTYTVTLTTVAAPEFSDTLEAMKTYYINRFEAEGFAFGADPNDDWALADMIAAGYAPSTALRQQFVDHAVGVMAQDNVKASDLSRCIIVLSALGVDARDLTTYSGAGLDAVAELATKAGTDPNIYTTPYMLIALQQFGAEYQSQIDILVSSILSAKLISGGWAGSGDTIDADSTGPVLLALAPYYDTNASVKEAVNSAIALIPSLCDSTGAVYSAWGYGASSTGVLLPGAVSGSYSETSSLVSGLLLLYPGNETRFQVYPGDTMSDEQGFRGLVANSLGGGKLLYDFSGNTLESATATTPTFCPVVFSVVPSTSTIALTDSSNSEVKPKYTGSYDLAAGTYDYTVSKSGYTSKTGSIIVSGTDASNHTAKTINVSLASIPALSDDITVSVIVKMHPSGSAEGTYTYKNNAAAYTTTIASQSVFLKAGSTVFDALDAALSKSSVSYVEKTAGYIRTINGISELDYGPYSGWLYMVNGKTATVSCRSYNLNSNASIVWFYTDDYTKEYGSEKWTGDTLPADSSTLTPSAAISGNSASATLSASDLSAAIQSNTGTTLTIEPTGTKGASAVEVNIPAASAASIASDTALGLSVVTPVGTVTIPNDALGSIASQASGSITIRVESADTSGLSAEQQQAVGQDPVYDISIFSGGTQISNFGGKAITISLPYELKEGEDASGVAVWYLNDAGELQRMRCTYDPATGMATFETTHLSKYLVGYSDAWYNPFEDVRTGDWFYNAVAFAANNQLFDGVSKTAFAPDQSMTRAMLATVLHRVEGSPSATAAADFGDVESGQWYSEAIAWATERGITKGYDNRTFGTNDSVTREQMAEILYRYAEYKKLDVSARADVSAFDDGTSVSSWAEQGVSWAVSTGLIQGVSATKLAPSALSTRAQVATVLMRWLGEK